ncbi:MAG: lipid-A-disaccharide synthase [Alphaproteobacteria bacterium]
MAQLSSAKKNIKIAMIAGEPSGDDLGGAIIRALKIAVKKKYPKQQLTFIGIGGASMAAAGLKSFFPISKIAKMGLVELLPHIPEMIGLIKKTIIFLKKEKPDILITIDIPDFSKRVARGLADQHFKKIHLVAPSVWAWRSKRRFLYAKIFDALFCLYPFEAKYFADTKLKTFTMGHPLVAEANTAMKKYHRQPIKKYPQVLMLAGSRYAELRYHLPLLCDVIKKNNFLPAKTHYVFYTRPYLKADLEYMIKKYHLGSYHISIISDDKQKWRWFFSSDVALVCMGTATLEVLLAGLPMVAFYKTAALTVFIVRKLIKVATVCLPNLLAGKNIVPELIQKDASTEKLITLAKQQYDIGKQGVKRDYTHALKKLRLIPDPATRAANEIVKWV